MKKVLLFAGVASLSVEAAAADPPPLSDPNEQPSASTSSSGTDWAGAKAQADAEAAAYTAAKAAADAKKALIEAEAAAAKAKYGGINAMSGVTPGSITGAADGAKAEAMLLTAKATEQAADRLASELQSAGIKINGPVIVLTDMNELSTVSAVQFDTQTALLRGLLDGAKAECLAALSASSGAGPYRQSGQFRSIIPVAGALLDSAAKVASYFQTDYTFGGVAITEPTNLTASSVTSAIRSRLKVQSVMIPANIVAADATPVVNTLTELQNTYAEVLGLAAAAKARSAEVKAKAAASAARLDAAEARATSAATSFETFSKALINAPADKAPPPIINVLREKKLQAALKGNPRPVALLVTSSKAGAYYTKKNLWTFLAGSPPLYTMGGVSLAYNLFDPDTGLSSASGAVAEHGGYRSVGAVEREFRER